MHNHISIQIRLASEGTRMIASAPNQYRYPTGAYTIASPSHLDWHLQGLTRMHHVTTREELWHGRQLICHTRANNPASGNYDFFCRREPITQSSSSWAQCRGPVLQHFSGCLHVPAQILANDLHWYSEIYHHAKRLKSLLSYPKAQAQSLPTKNHTVQHSLSCAETMSIISTRSFCSSSFARTSKAKQVRQDRALQRLKFLIVHAHKGEWNYIEQFDSWKRCDTKSCDT